MSWKGPKWVGKICKWTDAPPIWQRLWTGVLTPSLPQRDHSNFWVFGWNSLVWAFKWNLFSSTFTWHYLECNSSFLVGAWNPRVWPFKWNLLSSTFTWFRLFFSMLLNNIRNFLDRWLELLLAVKEFETLLLFWLTEQTVRGVTTVRAGSTDLWRHAGHKPSACGWNSRQSR